MPKPIYPKPGLADAGQRPLTGRLSTAAYWTPVNGRRLTLDNGRRLTPVNGRRLTLDNGRRLTLDYGRRLTVVNGRALTLDNGRHTDGCQRPRG
jgi:hypothetical protein